MPRPAVAIDARASTSVVDRGYGLDANDEEYPHEGGRSGHQNDELTAKV